MDMVAEGVITAKSVHELSIKYQVDMPISNAVYQILFEKMNPKTIVLNLMSRDLIQEKIAKDKGCTLDADGNYKTYVPHSVGQNKMAGKDPNQVFIRKMMK